LTFGRFSNSSGRSAPEFAPHSLPYPAETFGDHCRCVELICELPFAL
jgi:hypothetical protein